MKNFLEFFKVATGKSEPYNYQCRLACGERNQSENRDLWLSRGAQPVNTIINIPTGLGKTAAVALAFLWNRLLCAEGKNRGWQTRLVYCLPMRALVEQTAQNIETFLKNLEANAEFLDIKEKARDELQWLCKHSPVILMGGEEPEKEKREWDIYPEKPCIIIGTQDMLISRALNRGFGSSPYKWPVHFGLLNCDALWVFDETQLMGVSMETSAQMNAFRRIFSNGKTNCVSWWMSATMEESRLKTIDNNNLDYYKLTLCDEDFANQDVNMRINARKTLEKAPIESGKKEDDYVKTLAKFICEKRAHNSMTLVILNRVPRAQKVYSALKKIIGNSVSISLIHSRFRPCDRKLNEALLKADGERIIVATQAVEAGVDCSAKVLITEIAPWKSLVQRFGRCNRYGEFNDGAQIYWVDIPANAKSDEFLPYSESEINEARKVLQDLRSAKITDLNKIKSQESEDIVRPIIRKKDIIELFDTTPDMSGLFIDVSRFIRESKDSEVQLFWRENIVEPINQEISPVKDELCKVPIGQFKEFIKKAKKSVEDFRVFKWDYLTGEWDDRVDDSNVYPGCIYLLDVNHGGYEKELGWTGDINHKPDEFEPINASPITSDHYQKDYATYATKWVRLSDHCKDVQKMMEQILSSLQNRLYDFFSNDEIEALKKAALWHDVGKAHPVFQKALKQSPPPIEHELYAKSPNPYKGYERPYFRHELASALAWLLTNDNKESEFDNLVAYLIAAHHGKVRLSIRSMPDEKPEQPGEDKTNIRIARGIKDGDELPPVKLNGENMPKIIIDLSFMEIGEQNGRASWLQRMITLRDKKGVFKLAYLEALIRAADARASALYNNQTNINDKSL